MTRTTKKDLENKVKIVNDTLANRGKAYRVSLAGSHGKEQLFKHPPGHEYAIYAPITGLLSKREMHDYLTAFLDGMYA